MAYQVVKNLPANVRDIRGAVLVPELETARGEGQGNPLQFSCLENLMDRGAWWATVHRVVKCQTRLKWLSKYKCIQLLQKVKGPWYGISENARDKIPSAVDGWIKHCHSRCSQAAKRDRHAQSRHEKSTMISASENYEQSDLGAGVMTHKKLEQFQRALPKQKHLSWLLRKLRAYSWEHRGMTCILGRRKLFFFSIYFYSLEANYFTIL